MMLLPGGPLPPGGNTVLGTRWSAQMEQAYADIQRYNQQKARSLDGYLLPSGLTLVHAIQAMRQLLDSGEYLEGDPAAQQDLRAAMEALLKPLRYDEALWREKGLLRLDESVLPGGRRRRRSEHHAHMQSKKGERVPKKPLSPFITKNEARQMVVLLYLLFDAEDPIPPVPAYEGGRSDVSSPESADNEDEVNGGLSRSQVEV